MQKEVKNGINFFSFNYFMNINYVEPRVVMMPGIGREKWSCLSYSQQLICCSSRQSLLGTATIFDSLPLG
jgi:hypothetical protein